MRRILVHLRHGHLVSAPETFDLVSVDLLGTAPSFGAAQYHHRPSWPFNFRSRSARLLLDAPDFPYAVFQSRSHCLVHAGGIGAFDEVRLVSVTAEQGFELLMRDAGKNGRVGYLVAVQMEHRQHRAVPSRIEKLVRVPGGRQRTGFRLAIADHNGHDQIRIVESSAIGVRHRISELAAFVDRTGCLRSAMATDPAWKRELLEQPLQ